MRNRKIYQKNRKTNSVKKPKVKKLQKVSKLKTDFSARNKTKNYINAKKSSGYNSARKIVQKSTNLQQDGFNKYTQKINAKNSL